MTSTGWEQVAPILIFALLFVLMGVVLPRLGVST